MSLVSEERLDKIKEVVANRQFDLTVILENVTDPHNVGAVLRSCDSVGIREIFLISENPYEDKYGKFIGKTTSSGSLKWVKFNYFEDCGSCIAEVRKRYDIILCTHMSADAQSLYDIDLTKRVALVFGNETNGISTEMLNLCDGNFLIPQVGMVQSLNISVACAVSLYEAFRQRNVKGMYPNTLSEHPSAQQSELFSEFLAKHKPRIFSNNKALALKYLSSE